MAKKPRTRGEQIAIVGTVLGILYFLLQFLLPQFVPTVDARFSQEAVQWFGSKFSYQAILLSPILVTCLILFACFTLRYIRLHREQESPAQQDKQSLPLEDALQRQTEMLQHLSGEERELLRSFFDQDKTCLELPEKGAALSLRMKGILHLPSQHYDQVPNGYDVHMQYCVSDWAWKYIKQHPRVLNPKQTRIPTKAESRLDTLRYLSGFEKHFLWMGFERDSHWISVEEHERAAAQGMVDKGILFHPEGHPSDFCINGWVWKMLKDNPKLLE
jgi:hypothetical protein